MTDQSAAIDIPTDMTTMTATNDVEAAITGINMNEIVPQSMIGEGMTGAKGTGTSDEIRREGFFSEKNVKRQLKITMSRRHRRIEKRKKPDG